MGFVTIFWKNNVQDAYSPKISNSGQIVSEILAQLCCDDSIQILLNLAWFIRLGVSVKRGPDTCGWRMRMGKCGWKNADGKKNTESKKRKKKKTRNVDGTKKINKQTIKERNLSFKSLSHGWTLHLHTERDANSWHSFVPCNSFH